MKLMQNVRKRGSEKETNKGLLAVLEEEAHTSFAGFYLIYQNAAAVQDQAYATFV